jgi:cytochrome c biogenesis protein CcmG/thiol:disulfide interchange protein DsbE
MRKILSNSSIQKKVWLVLFGLMTCLACSPSRTAHAQSLKQTGDRKDAPEFALKDMNGKTVRLSDFKGKALVVDFWATWCGPCQIEIPWFMDFERKYKDQGFAVIGIAMDDEGWQAVKPFAEKMKMNYRVVLGNDQTADLYGGIEALPTTILIDRDGKIAGTHVGLAGKQDFQDAIEKLLETPAQTRTAQLHFPSFRAN